MGRPTRERAGLAMREMLKAVNVRVDIQRVPWDKFINEIEGKYNSVTKEDIQRVARTYFKDTNRSVITTVPKRAPAPTTGSN